jgi:ribosome maturation factor RimP
LLDKELQKLLGPVVMALGYELVGVERLSQGHSNALLRVYIDSSEGIKLSDCERVSYQISGVLEVQDPIPGSYTLEISSPGLDRPLFTLDHFMRFIGHKIRVRLTRPLLNAQRNFTGTLQRVEDHNVIIVMDGIEYSLPYDQIDKARLVPDEPQK